MRRLVNLVGVIGFALLAVVLYAAYGDGGNLLYLLGCIGAAIAALGCLVRVFKSRRAVVETTETEDDLRVTRDGSEGSYRGYKQQ